MASRKSSVESIVPGGTYTATIRAEYSNQPGMLGRVASVIGEVGGDISSIDLVEVRGKRMVRDFTVEADNSDHAGEIIAALKKLDGLTVRSASDLVFLAHLGGKIEVHNKIPVKTRRDLSTVYTPGVARVCNAIAADPDLAWNLTSKKNTVAIVTDGTAVLGLGDLGPKAALPVMEGKAMLLKELAGVDAWPLCLDTKDRQSCLWPEVAKGENGRAIGDNCDRAELDILVFHDDQHGTTVVVLAALINALRVVGKKIGSISVCISGVGAAGTACAQILKASGVRSIVGVDLHGIVYPCRPDGMSPDLERFASEFNPNGVEGTVHDAIIGTDVFIGVSAPDVIGPEDVRQMNQDPIVFALANPDPECRPEEIEGIARVIATGRSDYPNQINNVLCFPGLFKGALDVRASEVNEPMKLAAAKAIASVVSKSELSEEYIIPSVFNRNVARAVARDVAQAAKSTNVSQRSRRRPEAFL